ncbi:hypothetical protein RFI_32817, partial [Reticulomyxa filosa]
ILLDSLFLQNTENDLIASIICLYLRLIENHGHADVKQIREKEIAFASRLMQKFEDCWLNSGRDIARLLQQLYPVSAFKPIWKALESQTETASHESRSKLIYLLSKHSKVQVLSVLINKYEQKDLVQLNQDIMGVNGDQASINHLIDEFVNKYLKRNQAERHTMDVMRYIMCCYQYHADNTHDDKIFPKFHPTFMLQMLKHFILSDWKDEFRGLIHSCMLFEVLYSESHSEDVNGDNRHSFACGDIVDQLLSELIKYNSGVNLCNLIISIIELIKHYRLKCTPSPNHVNVNNPNASAN